MVVCIRPEEQLTALKKLRVLIVDDDWIIVDGFYSILENYPDIEVVGSAYNGLEAFDEALRTIPDVILMDAQIRDVDGVEASRRIREHLPAVKILFLTVHARFVEEALAAGADGYLMKDSSRQELIQAVRALGALP